MNDAKPRRRVKLVPVLVGVAVAAALWMAHPFVLGAMLREVISRGAAGAGLRVTIADIDAALFRPWVFRGVRVRAEDPAVSRTAADADAMVVRFVGAGRLLWVRDRFLDEIGLDGLRGVLDFREGALPPQTLVEQSAEEEKAAAALVLKCLPRAMRVTAGSVEILGDDQIYRVSDVEATFSEEAAGKLRAGSAAVAVAGWSRRFAGIDAGTAWRGGSLFLVDWEVEPDVRVGEVRVDLARPGGVALGVRAEMWRGSVRGDVTWEVRGRELGIDAALWASGIDVASMARFLGFDERVGGRLSEVKATFRGLPDHPIDAQASLRLTAEAFRWNDRGWESLTLGANMIHRRLAVNEFSLVQKDNALTANGEVSVGERSIQPGQAPFLLNISGSINDLGALAGLVGEPFHETSGRMSLSGTVSGDKGRLDGFLSVEASDVVFRDRPVQSVRLDVLFEGAEARVAACEVWSGDDTVRGTGAIQLAAPHQYAGEVSARVADLSAYHAVIARPEFSEIWAGRLQGRWQGDGSATWHSGAFTVALEDFVSAASPEGVTGRFAGTYSPENVYFSGFELERAPMRFSSRVTLAASGVQVRDGELVARGRTLADCELSLPFNPFAIMAGESWTAALDPARPLYARVRSRGALDLGELARLGGQDPAVSGALTGAIDATGSLADLQVTGTLRVDGMRPASGGDVRADAAVDFRAAGGVGTATARLTPRGFSPVTGVIEGPFGFTRAGDGGLSWLNPTGSVTGRIDFPRTRMEVFRAFAPGVTRLDGTLAGGVEVGGTISRPELNGALTLANGLVEFSPRAPRIANVQASVAFDTSRAVIERFTGDVGAGPFALRGSIGLTDPTNPSMDLTLEGRKILIARDRELRMRANIDLVARGDAGGGAVTGAIRLVDSRIYKRIEITPLLVPSPVDDQVYVPPRLAGRIPPPWSAWTMNVTIANETPFRILGNIASGEIVPELTIGGTLGDPLPEGTVRLLNTQAFLPFTTMTIENGRIDFTRAAPWIPQLDVRATAQAADYSIQAYASGPITERQLILRSDPPLSQESIITLLTTGLVPGTFTGSGFGEAAAGQGSLLLLRALARQFEPEGVDLDSLVNRVNLAAVPPQYPGAASGLRGTFRLWEGLSLLTERDDLGYYNAGVTYSLRLK